MNLNRLRVILATCETHKGEMQLKKETGFSRWSIQHIIAFCVKTGLIEKHANSRPTYITTETGWEVLRNLSECIENPDNVSKSRTQAYIICDMKGKE